MISNAGSVYWSSIAINSITGESTVGSWQISGDGMVWVPGGVTGRAIVFALGDSWHQFGDGSFNTDTWRLTSGDGTVFAPGCPIFGDILLGMNFITGYLFFELGCPSELEYSLGVNESGVQEWFSPLNQWYAIVYVDDATPNHFGIDVFHAVLDCDEHSGWNAGGTDYTISSRTIDAGQYTTVPEPSTAILTLVGTVLLLCRRK